MRKIAKVLQSVAKMCTDCSVSSPKVSQIILAEAWLCDKRVHLYLSETTEFISSGFASLKSAMKSGVSGSQRAHTRLKRTKDSGTQGVKVIQIYIFICKICTNLRPRAPSRAHRRTAPTQTYKSQNASAEYENNKITASLDQQRQRDGTAWI